MRKSRHIRPNAITSMSFMPVSFHPFTPHSPHLATSLATSHANVVGPTRRKVLAGLSASVFVVPESVRAQTPTPVITLTAAPAKRRLRPEPAPETDVWAYNGETPGPVLRLKKGQSTTIRLVNNLPQPTTLHISGLRTVNTLDGVAGLTQPAIAPGQSYDYTFTPQDSGTYLYHPLVPGQTAEQVERGLSGLFIVEEDIWNGNIDREIAVLLDDWRITPEGQVDAVFGVASDSARLGRLGNVLSVNGRAVPEVITVQPRARVRLRIGGIMNARVLPMTFQKMAKATVIAIDGQPCDPFDPLKRQVIVAPGSRYDIVLDLPEKAGEETLVSVALGDGIQVVRFVTEGEPLPAKPAIPALPVNPSLPDAIRLQEARRAEFTIAGGWDAKDPAGAAVASDVIAKKFSDATKVWTLNYGFPSGIAGKPIFSVKKGSVVVVALTNRGSWAQILRLHGHVFRLLHALDDGWEPYFLDTVIVPEGKTVRVAFVADNPGKWLIRSTVLEHMESGVLSWFEVLP
jgi:FtsP/CotA-like multicopper oxidase with cupredoxin domain